MCSFDIDFIKKVFEGLEGRFVLGFEGLVLGYEGVDVCRIVIRFI